MTVCTNCGKWVEIIHESTYPNGERKPEQTLGGAIWDLSGGYSEFIDSAFIGVNTRVVLCHDCALAVFRALPGIAKAWASRDGTFWHAYNGDKPCCEFAWTIDESDNRSHGWNDHTP